MGTPTIEPTPEQIAELASSDAGGPIAMLNLLRFREEALEPDSGMTGAEAYGLYGQEVAPFLEAAGAMENTTAIHICSACTCGRDATEYGDLDDLNIEASFVSWE